jgi:hypothetical protein
MDDGAALDRFASLLDADVVADMRSWAGDAELGKLYAGLNAHDRLKTFLDAYAEALVARHLRARGAALRFEVPTPRGKACDFEVTTDEGRFYLHVKRLDTEQPGRRRLTISSRLRYLERIPRPYMVSVRWHEGTRDAEMERLVREAADFIMQARVGDELVVHDDDGREIGGVLIAAPWEGSHVSLAIGLPSGFIDDTPRMRRLLRRAHTQFMPRADNVILICSSHAEDYEDFERALLGSYVERWDTVPPHGKRVAHGRAGDGLWHGKGFTDSRAAGWFRMTAETSAVDVSLLLRRAPAPDPGLGALLEPFFPRIDPPPTRDGADTMPDHE